MFLVPTLYYVSFSMSKPLNPGRGVVAGFNPLEVGFCTFHADLGHGPLPIGDKRKGPIDKI
jgi:hypothetical protein